MNLKRRIIRILSGSLFLVFLFSATLMPSRASAGVVATMDFTHIGETMGQTVLDVANWAKDYAYQLYEWARDEGIALAYKKALGYFLNQLAYDTATYLVSGDKGQGAMFYTESWGDYLKNVGDNAVGHFLEELGSKGPVKFNLCDPGLPITMKIGIGIMNVKDPKEPDCSFTEMKKEWEKALNDPSFMSKFVKMYQYQSNDFGITLSLQSKAIENEKIQKDLAAVERTTNQGFKDVTEKVSKAIKTPSNVIRSYVDTTVKDSNSKFFQYTGHALADAIDVFTNTLISKLLEEWLKKGLSRSHEDTSYQGDWGGFDSFSGVGGSSGSGSGGGGGSSYSGGGGLTNYEANTSASGGIAKVKKQFESLIAPNFAVKGDYEALNDLVTCSKPTDASSNQCVITDSVRQAIDKKLSVVDAAEQGFLNKSGTFGFKADGLEPSYTEGFPYRSIMIMRKYRIVPVGWELAAQYIMQNRTLLQNRSFNLGDMIACFDPGDRYAGFSAPWCQGLVDPAWVLKAPQNYCKREGAGPDIISETVVGKDDTSQLAISRDTSYCADEQTCVKENSDGSCEVYGYCTEDRRKYNFSGESCDPNYNTCQSFRASDGRTISLLENTLDYSTCSADVVGCENYQRAVGVQSGGVAYYNPQQDIVNWYALFNAPAPNSFPSINLDSAASKCEASAEGCHEFIRTKPGLGVNLLTNPSFDDGTALPGWGPVGTQVADSKEGPYALQISANPLSRTIVVDPTVGASYTLDGYIFTLSLYVRDCPAAAVAPTISLDGTTQTLEADDWRFVSLTRAYSAADGNDVNISITDANTCVIDAMKLERTTPEANGTPTQYVPYRSIGVVYEKLLPDYLFASCYANSDGFIERVANSPDACDDYARPCTSAEVNCELYSSKTDYFEVPAVVGANDYCPEECVGYDTYHQQATKFEGVETEHFIPEEAEECSLFAVGCDAFTNLDQVDNPEAREYYVSLRHCVDADTPTCEPYFMWEGSDETGYQLKVHRLNTNGSGAIDLIDSSLSCSVQVGDPNYDAECREYYDDAGNPFYELHYNTISCTDDCHPYRRDVVADDPVNCANNSGTWDADGSYCVIMGVPQEGIACSAEEAGCRAYSGNTGANERIIFEHSFERGTNQGWVGGVNSNASAIVGQHSLSVASEATQDVSGELMLNRSYVLQFLAAGNGGAANLEIYFENTDSMAQSHFEPNPLAITETWGAYEINLDNLDQEGVFLSQYLVISGDDDFFIDNIKLVEVVDRHYLIEGSWSNNCDYVEADPNGSLTVPANLYAGCDAYTDRDNIVHNLYQFNHLCSEEAVGCELMIDTHNSSDYMQTTVGAVAGVGGVTTPADNFAFVVYDKEKACTVQDKGCERMGLRYYYDYGDANPYRQYFDNYLRNDPDKYNESLCSENQTRCDSWESRDGVSYFKDPNDMICEWRLQKAGGLGNWDWFKKKVKRCDASANGSIEIATERSLCSDSSDCALTNVGSPVWCESDSACGGSACVDNECRFECITDENDYRCDMDNNQALTPSIPPKTVGQGGIGGRVRQPLGHLENEMWAGACPGGQDDCTEYIDPVSSFSPSVDKLMPHTLYVKQSGTVPTCSGATYYLLNLAVGAGQNRFTPVLPAAIGNGSLFYFARSEDCPFNPVSVIREAVVDYQLEYSLEKGACNGMVDLDQGCYLFNERSIEGEGVYTNLNYNANNPSYSNGPMVPSTGNNSNVILKVTPDRECNKWLSCRSFIKDSEGNDVCFDVGLCERFDENGNCAYFSTTNTKVNQVYPAPTNDISNLTGYSLVSYGNYITGGLMTNYYPVSGMSQYGQVAIVPNGSFEKFDKNAYPVGWTSSSDEDWKRDHFKVINNPVAAQKENIKYPVDGAAFLKYGAKSNVRSEPIQMVRDDYYVLSFYANTNNLAQGFASLNFSGASLSTSWRMNAGLDWQKWVIPFRATANQGMIEFYTAAADGYNDGNVFIDNVSIDSTLNSRYDNIHNRQWYTPQDCRLYPEASSLSCDYVDSSGHRKQGWPGYCLQYDRYPGNPKACLLWYPIDRINGDGFEEGGGYIDREPLYYCIGYTNVNYRIGGGLVPQILEKTDDPKPMEEFVTDNNFGAQSSGDIDITHRHSNPFAEDEWDLEQLGLGDVDPKWLLWSNISHIRIRHSSPSVMCAMNFSESWDHYYRFDKTHPGYDCVVSDLDSDCVPWGVTPGYRGGYMDPASNFLDDPDYEEEEVRFGGIRLLGVEGLSFTGIKTSSVDIVCDHPDMQILEVVIFPRVYYCTDVAQYVSPTGQNKYFSNVVYEGSAATTICNNSPEISTAFTGNVDAFGDPLPQICDYDTDLAPFGAVTQPGMEIDDWAIMSNPYSWDSKEETVGNQPLFYEIPNGSMFNDSQARMGQGYTNGEVTSKLFGQYYGRWHFFSDSSGEIPDVTGHYKKHDVPFASNNTSGGGTGISPVNFSPNPVYVNDMVKLSFNTRANVSHLPLISIRVQWGDGSVTSVSGMEMRDRPDAANPHVMYHIYDRVNPAGPTWPVTITVRDNWGVSSSVTHSVTVQPNY